MSHPDKSHGSQEVDPLESIIHSVPVVIPLLGGLLIFLLAFIAVFLA